MDPMQTMIMMMMKTQKRMLASKEAREQREKARELKLADVLDKISSRLDRLEVTNPNPSPIAEIAHNTEINLTPVASFVVDATNPPPLSSVLNKGKPQLNPNPTPQSSTHQYISFQIVPPRESTPQLPRKSQYPPLLKSPHKPSHTQAHTSSSQIPPQTPLNYPPYTPPYNPVEPPPQQQQTHFEPPLQQHHYHLPKLDFPSFDGTEMKSWIRRTERYFSIMGMEEWRKVEMAAMYLTGKAEVWLYGAMVREELRTWEEFKEAVALRFGGERPERCGRRVQQTVATMESEGVHRGLKREGTSCCKYILNSLRSTLSQVSLAA
ncbi:hypothetical protein Dimus_037841 [Dionaea muscipula]